MAKDEDDFSTIQVRSTISDNRLGGDDWDQRIMDWLVQQVKQKEGVDLSKDSIAVPRLKEEAERAKKELSSASSATINIPYATQNDGVPVHVNETLSRAKFEDMTSDLLERTKKPFNDAITEAA